YQFAHGLKVGGRGLVVIDGTITHDVGAHRRVRYLRTDIQGLGLAVKSIKVFWEGFPFPLYAFRKRGSGDVFHAFHDLDEPVTTLGFNRGETDTAVAHDRRGDAMPGRGA